MAFDVDGVLSPSVIPLGTDGIPRRMANIKDGYALQLAVRCGLKIAIISGAVADGLTERFAHLGITDVFLGAGMKREVFERWMEHNGLFPCRDGVCRRRYPPTASACASRLSELPLPMPPPDIIGIAGYVSPANGGYGVARDLLEEILRAKGQWPSTDKANGW